VKRTKMCMGQLHGRSRVPWRGGAGERVKMAAISRGPDYPAFS
jgi:hypothetical protein